MTKNKYKFTIIMSVYNVENYIDEAVESIINQTIGFEENIQIVFINDGSTDNSEEHILKYKDLYPNNIVYKKKKNAGLSAARNDGLKLAKGKYVNFFDPDDILSESVLEEVYNFFEAHEKEIEIVSIPLEYFEARTGLHRKYKYMGTSNRVIDLQEEPHNFVLSAAASFYKLEKIKDKKFDTEMVCGEDVYFNIQNIYSSSSKLGYVCENKVMYYYRKRHTKKSLIDNLNLNEKGYESLAKRQNIFNHKKLNNWQMEIILYELQSYLKYFCEDLFQNKKDYTRIRDNYIKYIKAIPQDFIINKSRWVDTIDYKISLLKYQGLDIVELINNNSLSIRTSAHVQNIRIEDNQLFIDVIYNNFGSKKIELIIYSNKKEILPYESNDYNTDKDLYYGETLIDITHERKFKIAIKEKQTIEFKLKYPDKIDPIKKIKHQEEQSIIKGKIKINNKKQKVKIKVESNCISIEKEKSTITKIKNKIKKILKKLIK